MGNIGISLKITFDAEYCIAAMQRSGHHAIINWIRLNLNKPSLFLNECKLGENPFTSCRFANIIYPALGKVIMCEDPQNIENANFILYNYEDVLIDKIRKTNIDSKRIERFAISRKIFFVNILRDPFNTLASKLRWHEGSLYPPSKSDLFEVRDLWIAFAKEYINKEKPDTTVWVNYNFWFSSENHRKLYSEILQLSSFNNGINEVAKYGPTIWGDSFDGIKYDGCAQQMKVFERWKTYKSNKFFLELIRNKELVELSKEIFQEIPEINEAIIYASRKLC